MDNAFIKDLKEWENDPEYQTELLILEINDLICDLMQQQNVTRSELARRIGTNRSYITRLLNGYSNINMKTLVKIAAALGASVEINFVPASLENMPIQSCPEEPGADVMSELSVGREDSSLSISEEQPQRTIPSQEETIDGESGNRKDLNNAA